MPGLDEDGFFWVLHQFSGGEIICVDRKNGENPNSVLLEIVNQKIGNLKKTLFRRHSNFLVRG